MSIPYPLPDLREHTPVNYQLPRPVPDEVVTYVETNSNATRAKVASFNELYNTVTNGLAEVRAIWFHPKSYYKPAKKKWMAYQKAKNVVIPGIILLLQSLGREVNDGKIKEYFPWETSQE